MKFGAILRACRERVGMSQEEIAFRLNRSRTAITKLENDQQKLDVQTFLQWLDITGAKEVAVAFFCGMDGLSIMQNILQVMGVG